MFSRLLKLPEVVRATYDLSSLECIVHAAAPCPVPVKEQMIDWFGPDHPRVLRRNRVATGSPGATARSGWRTRERWGESVVGELLILEADGAGVPAGHARHGVVLGRHQLRVLQRTRQDGLTVRRTNARTVGDIGHVDDDGFLYLTDRAGHMIISGGVNIYPQETENLLVTHPKVIDVAVFGVPNDDLGEEVKAVVQLIPGVEPATRLSGSCIAFCREHLARFKCPRYGRLRGRAAPPPHRQALQAAPARPLLGRCHVPPRLRTRGAAIPRRLGQPQVDQLSSESGP